MSEVTSAVAQVLGSALAIAAVMVGRVLEKRFEKLTEEEEATDVGE